MKKNKSGQEEMVGFALIVIIVAVIILIFVGFSIKKPQKEPIESYEVESFIQSFLQHTSDCKDKIEYLSVQKLMIGCFDNEKCEEDGRETCEVLNATLTGILNEGWKVGEGGLTRGYLLEVSSGVKKIVSIQEGNVTKNYKGAMQPLGRNDIQIEFTAYY